MTNITGETNCEVLTMAEKEYIERGALKSLFDERYDTAFMQMHTRENKEHWKSYATAINWGRNTITDSSAADVVEVRHGKWVEHFSFGVWHYDCPFCDDGYATKERDKTPPNFCPNCGAKMDGGEN